MPKFHTHHILFTFLFGALTGILLVVASIAIISHGSEPASALQSSAPSCAGCNLPVTVLPPPTCVNVITGEIKPCATSTSSPAPSSTASTGYSTLNRGSGAGEGGPTSVTEISDPLVKILKPADGSTLATGHVDVLVRGHAGYINRSGYRYYTTWDNWGFVHDGTSIGNRVSGNSYPCDEKGNSTGDTIHVDAWCATFSFDTEGGSHRLTVWGSGIYQGGVKDAVSYSATAASPTPATNDTKVNTRPVSRIGTLNAKTEGYMYIVGPQNGYLGYKMRVINLYTGNYTLYVYGPKTWKLCNKVNFRIESGKTKVIRYSGGACQ